MTIRVAASFALAMLCGCNDGGLNLVHVSTAYPAFQRLEVFSDRVTVVSPDWTSLRGLTLDGSERWRRALVGPPVVGRWDDEHLYVQQNYRVFKVAVSDGAEAMLFDVPQHEKFVRDATTGLVYLIDDLFEKNTFQLLDAQSRRPRWKREDIETILSIEPDVLIASTASRDYEAHVRYSTRDMAIAGVDRRTGELRWRIPLGDAALFIRATRVPACLVASTPGDLLCIDPVSGEVLGRRKNPQSFYSYADVVASGQNIAFLERTSGDALLRVASLPSFDIVDSVPLSGDEATLTLHGDYVLRLSEPGRLPSQYQ